MNTILSIPLGVMLGFLGHKLDPVIDSWRNTPLPWKRLVRYGIGYSIASFVSSFIECGFDLQKFARSLKDKFFGGFMVGIGVMFGYALDKEFTDVK